MNNAKFPEYFEKGRLALLEHIGYPEEKIRENGAVLVVYDARYRYKKSVNANEVVSIESRFVPVDIDYKVVMHHEMLAEKRGRLSFSNQEIAFKSLKDNELVRPVPEWFVEAMYHSD
jgi:YbgC/YbaW family acyl-CoA thioester hydrolase